MVKLFKQLKYKLVYKLILAVGMMLLLTISAWAYYNIKYQKKELMDNVLTSADKLSNTIRLGTHYAMMLNSRDDINQIISNIARQPEFENIRIYNKEGQIKFSNRSSEVSRITNIKAEACYICHRTEPPQSTLDLKNRTRIFNSPKGHRLLGIISPIRNEPGCSTGGCHVHPRGKKILGALDVVVSLERTDRKIINAEKGAIGLAFFVFLTTSALIYIFVLKFVNQPIKKLIQGTHLIAKGDYSQPVNINKEDEMGQLANAISQMGQEIEAKQAELNRQKDEYQNLFERVPCLITVQDRDFRLIRYNREFATTFNPRPGDYCFTAYKGLDKKCTNCPVEMTFQDGNPHFSEETGTKKDGTPIHWFVGTSPIKNAESEIVSVMELSLDITPRKKLEQKLELSEKKYHAIFNNIPNPVFVLDMDTLDILDCNQSAMTIYGYTKDELIHQSFLDLFKEKEEKGQAEQIKLSPVINQAKHVNKEGEMIYVDIWISPSEYSGRKVLLVTTSDITKRLETEQQLFQAGKMATLGEMASGVAHELNQPLSVIKTASTFMTKKINKKELIKQDTLINLLTKMEDNVDRASRIINHMRQFARKSETDLKYIRVNEVLERAFEIFSQQLKVRGIELIQDLEDNLPGIMADPGRLEQVFINLLVNARDAIEEKSKTTGRDMEENRITIRTRSDDKDVIVEVRDTGVGIPDAIADKVFEPFFTTKEVGKGTGLGLSITYGIIKECGGDIEVTPGREEGACFVIRFPIPSM
ncbi:MAG: PAS domain S-box protein [Desulfobacterales bacterium]|nr:PAS domain S-box protein [Desulfobacterales bacterium]